MDVPFSTLANLYDTHVSFFPPATAAGSELTKPDVHRVYIAFWSNDLNFYGVLPELPETIALTAAELQVKMIPVGRNLVPPVFVPNDSFNLCTLGWRLCLGNPAPTTFNLVMVECFLRRGQEIWKGSHSRRSR